MVPMVSAYVKPVVNAESDDLASVRLIITHTTSLSLQGIDFHVSKPSVIQFFQKFCFVCKVTAQKLEKLNKTETNYICAQLQNNPIPLFYQGLAPFELIVQFFIKITL